MDQSLYCSIGWNGHNREELFKALESAVVEMNEGQVVDQRIDAFETIDQALAKGMERAGQLFEEEEYFIPELLLCSDAMYTGLDILKHHLMVTSEGETQKVVIGVVEEVDTHDIDKNLVKIKLETSGFKITDLGCDVPPARFVEVANLLEQQNVRDSLKVMVGGGPILPAFAKRISSDGYASNAAEAVRLAKALLS